MTNVLDMEEKLYRRINQQNTPDEIGHEDLIYLLCDAIEALYINEGRQELYSTEKLIKDNSGIVCEFEDDLSLDERHWVVKKAEIEFYKWVQSSVSDQKSYTTDAMSVTHGDKPYEHIGQTIDRLTAELDRIWYTMTRYNQLGVAD